MSSSLIVKAFLREGEVECRRFKMSEEQSGSVEKLKDKVKEVFPRLQDSEFTITYTDVDGDDVVISSDEELSVAVEEAMKRQQDLFKININLAQDKSEAETKAKGPSCNSCKADVSGVHFQCLQCSNYWLCQACEKQGEHYHHSMMRLNQPLPTQEQIWEQFTPWISMWKNMMGCGDDTEQSGSKREENEGNSKKSQDSKQSEDSKKSEASKKSEDSQNSADDKECNTDGFNLADFINQLFGGCEAKEEQGATGGSDIACDGCKKELKDVNFKCLHCANYHLCVECESKGMHQEHNMVRFPCPMPSQEDMMKHLQPWLSMFSNMNAQNGCGGSSCDHEQKSEEGAQQQQAYFPMFGFFPGSSRYNAGRCGYNSRRCGYNSRRCGYNSRRWGYNGGRCRDYARRSSPEEMMDQMLRAGTAAAEMFMGARRRY